MGQDGGSASDGGRGASKIIEGQTVFLVGSFGARRRRTGGTGWAAIERTTASTGRVLIGSRATGGAVGWKGGHMVMVRYSYMYGLEEWSSEKKMNDCVLRVQEGKRRRGDKVSAPVARAVVGRTRKRELGASLHF